MAKTRSDLDILNMKVYFCYVSKNIFKVFSTWDRNYTQSNKINIDNILELTGFELRKSTNDYLHWPSEMPRYCCSVETFYLVTGLA